MILKGLLLRLIAKPGKENELQQLLIDGLQIVNDEPKTINWYAFKINKTSFGIFDTFPDEDGLHQHHTGKLAKAILNGASELLDQEPSIEATEILAWK